MRELIVTAGYGYAAELLKPFLVSARLHLPAAEVVVFSHDGSTAFAAEIAAYNSQARVVVPAGARLRAFVWGSKRRRRLVRDVLKPAFAYRLPPSLEAVVTALFDILVVRFLWTQALLARCGSDCLVLLCDSRDVFFQGNPFADYDDRLLCGEEPLTIGECHINSAWIERAYSRTWLDRLADRPVLCAGVTLGSQAQVRTYVEAMVAEIGARRARLMGGGGVDQGIHNKLLHGDRILPFATSRNGDALLATLHYSDLSEFRFDEATGLRTAQGEAVKIVHQYDRHQRLADWVSQRY